MKVVSVGRSVGLGERKLMYPCTESRCAGVQNWLFAALEVSLSRGFGVLSSLPLFALSESVAAGAFNAGAVAAFAGGEAGGSGGAFDHGSGASSCLARQSFCQR